MEEGCPPAKYCRAGMLIKLTDGTITIKVFTMNDIIKNNKIDIHNLCKKYQVKKLYVFGSVCSEKFDDKSDIDFLISFKDIPIEEYSDNYFTLHELFENLFSRKIDLITENSLSNPYFIKFMEKTKTLIYE